jgi:DNA helicase-2/ATP-dependent DNA helicase PcrA
MPPALFQTAAFTPSDEQLAIQTSRAATVLVRANAGAAKTTTLALRAAESLQRGLPPEGIWALTTTEPAVEALQLALRKVGVAASDVKRMAVMSFDSLAQRVLRVAEHEPVPQLATAEAMAPVVREALQQLGLNEEPGGIEHYLRSARWLKGRLALDTARWAQPGEPLPLPELADALGLPVHELRLFMACEDLRYPALDGVDRPHFRFEHDATYDLARLLADPETTTPLEELHGLPRHVGLLLVDELHDLNAAGHAILQGLLAVNSNAAFCAVGDEDQVVHAAAGAEQRFLQGGLDLGGRQLTVLPLTASHRFAPALASVAHRLANKPYASAAAHKTQVRCLSCTAEPAAADAAQALQTVDALLAWSKETRRPLSDAAILLRHAHHSIALENALVERGVDYQTRGFHPYVRQPEVLLIRALLAVAGGGYDALRSLKTREELVRSVVLFCDVELGFEENEDEDAEARLQTAIRYIQADADMLRPFVEQQLIKRSSPQRAKAMTLAIAIAREALARPSSPAAASPGSWFGAFVQALDLPRWVEQVFVRQARREAALAYFEGLQQAAAQHASPQAYFERLAQLESRLEEGLATTQSAHKRAIRRAADLKSTVTLATVADVKGLEFEHVLIPFVETGRFPDPHAEAAWQERNLFYVGITRARSLLTVLAHQGRQSPYWLCCAGSARVETLQSISE